MLGQIFDLIFPPKCIFCNKMLNYGAKICVCENCRLKIPYINNKTLNLIKLNNYFDDIICICEYSGIIKEALIKYKFFNKPSFGKTFAQLIYDSAIENSQLEKLDVITSVPLHPKKEQKRGYNQSHLISKHLGSLLKIEVNKNLIKRIKNTNSQSLLNRAERLKNVKDAFIVTDKDQVKGKSILVLDDILTTGTTINECCKVLKKAGAAKVIAATVAAGRKF